MNLRDSVQVASDQSALEVQEPADEPTVNYPTEHGSSSILYPRSHAVQLELVAEREPLQGLSVTALAGLHAKSAAGETLTAPKVDSVNTFEIPTTLVPKRVSAKVECGILSLKLEPKLITVRSVEQ